MSDKTTPCYGKWDPFFGDRTSEAKQICSTCPTSAKVACLEMALTCEVPGVERFGTWGGLSANERNKRYGRRSA